MDFGVSIPTWGPLSAPDSMAAIARSAEALGYGYLSVSDHIVMPRQIDSRYPYSPTGQYLGDGEFLEQLTVLSFLAAHTSRVRLVTSVMVLPYRNPVHTAKTLATIDVLSHGRLTVGCGVGWMREEFEALGSPPYEERGIVSDEYIRAFRELWSSGDSEFEGKYLRFDSLIFEPKPVQKPGPPIWIGGESAPALRRAARLGDAWFPIASNPRHPLKTTDQLKSALDRLRSYAEAVDRDPGEIDIGFNRTSEIDWKAEPQRAADEIRDYQALGVRHTGSGIGGSSLDERLEQMEQFAANVMPLV